MAGPSLACELHVCVHCIFTPVSNARWGVLNKLLALAACANWLMRQKPQTTVYTWRELSDPVPLIYLSNCIAQELYSAKVQAIGNCKDKAKKEEKSLLVNDITRNHVFFHNGNKYLVDTIYICMYVSNLSPPPPPPKSGFIMMKVSKRQMKETIVIVYFDKAVSARSSSIPDPSLSCEDGRWPEKLG